MNISDTSIPGVFVLNWNVFKDMRGIFMKTFHKDFFEKKGLSFDIRESFVSVSHANVVRGMHFQLPPFDHKKLVYVISGRIMDVVLDIRKDSPTYGKYEAFPLEAFDGKVLFLPSGVAHGFASLQENSCVVYFTSKEYNPEYDSGIKWDSFGFEWKEIGINNPIVSKRDRGFEPFNIFKSPFKKN